MFNLLPRDESFFDQIEQLSSLVGKSTELLQNMVRSFPSVDGIEKQIQECRQQAAPIVQPSLCRLDAAFITPLDREDIMQLMTDLYDVVDKVAGLAKRFSLYKLERLYPNLQKQSETPHKVAVALQTIMGSLRKQKKLEDLSQPLAEIEELEKQAESNRDAFLAELFEGSPDPLEVMKKKELHDMMEGAIWDCENVTRTLGRVLLKNG